MDADRKIAARAARQHGLVSYAQALECGLDAAALTRRARSGALERLEPRVYRVCGAPRSFEQRLMQTVLGAGAGAVLSHGTAARLWELDGFGSHDTIDVSVPRGRRYRRARSHERSDLSPSETTTLRGLPVTRPPRTLLDLAATVDAALLERAYESAVRRGLVVDRTVRGALVTGAPGSARMRALLDERAGAPATESDLETRFLQLVRRAGLPAPRRQVRVGRYRVDLAWSEHRVAVELDGRTHDGHLARRRDNRRQNRILLTTDWRLLRYTWEDVVGDAARVVTELRRLLGNIRPRE